MIQLVLGREIPGWAIFTLTLWLHGALWLAAAALLGHPGLRLGARLRNRLWRLALVAPLLSATLPAVFAVAPPWRLATWRLTEAAAASAPGRVGTAAATPPVHVATAALAASVPVAPGEVIGRPAAHPPRTETAFSASRLLLTALVLVTLLRLGRLGGRALRFRRTLGPRALAPLEAQQVLLRLCLRAGTLTGVRLTTSTRIGCPIALGGREICSPRQALHALDGRLLDAVLGHELGHLERRDNAWLAAAAVLEAASLFQPFVPLAARRMRDSAEEACDDRAVELTRDPLGLARSLAEVASWDAGPSPVGLAHAIAAPGGLVARVERLLRAPERRLPTPLRIGTVAVLLLALPLAAPAVVRTAEADQPPPGAPAPPAAARPEGPRAPQPPRLPQAARPPLPAHPPQDFAGQIAALAVDESRLAIELDASRKEAARLQGAGAAAPQRQAQDEKIQTLERKIEAAAATRAGVEARFQREMERWGQEMERQGEAHAREVEQQLRHYQDQLQRNLEEVRRNIEQLRHNEDAARRSADQMKMEADRVRQEATRAMRERARAQADAATQRSEIDRTRTPAAAPPTPPPSVKPAPPPTPRPGPAAR